MNVELEEYKKSLVRRARIQATVYGAFSIIMLISVVFALVQREALHEARKEINQLNIELKTCQEREKTSEKLLSIRTVQLEKAIRDVQLASENVEKEYGNILKKTK